MLTRESGREKSAKVKSRKVLGISATATNHEWRETGKVSTDSEV